MGLITGAFGGLVIGIYYELIIRGLIGLSKNLGNTPQWANLGFLGTILRAGPIVSFLYFIILGGIGGLIGGFITEKQ